MDTTATYRSLHHGEMLNWYRIEKILGQGGFGVIYLATDTNLDHQVAIKEYRALLNTSSSDTTYGTDTVEINEQSDQGLKRFIAEARNLVRFKHPNIVRIMSVFEANDTAYMVMEFEEGVDLREYLKDPAHATEAALKALIKPVSEGLAEVHKHGFIHRDIKPANILVRKDGSPVLLDFGSARNALLYSEDPLTALVSAGYSPLEQYSDKSDEQQGPWTDIYALGAVLYYSISGVEPVDSAKRGSAILNGGHDPLLPAKMLGRERYSIDFLEAIDWALQFKIGDRPQSLSDWIPALLRSSNARENVTRLIETPTHNAATTRQTTTRQKSPHSGEQNAAAEQDSGTAPESSRQDPLFGFSMRDQPAPREIEAARVRRTSKPGFSGMRGAIILCATLATVFVIWQFLESFGASKPAQPEDTGSVVPALTSTTSDRQANAQEAEEDGLLGRQVEFARVAAEDLKLAQTNALQLEEEKLAAQIEQQRIAALAEAGAIATTKQIAAQKAAAEALKQAEAAALEKQRLVQEAEKEASREAARLRSARRQFNRLLELATKAIDEGKLSEAEQSLDKAAALNSRDPRLESLRTRWVSALADSREPVSDADFDGVIAQFDGLRRALESNDVATMNTLTDASNQNALFTQLMASFASLDITISKIRVRNANKSITATLRIEHMARSNGDRATPSSAYRERTISSLRREGEWSLIHW